MKDRRTLRAVFVVGLALALWPRTAEPEASPTVIESPQAPRLRSVPIPDSNSQPIEITRGPDGNMWFTEQDASKVARITPQGVITEFPTPTFGNPQDITAGPDGNVWFTEGCNGVIAAITPAGQIREIEFSPSDCALGITAGPDGNIWFTAALGNSVWRLELPSRVLTSFPLPTPDASPADITVGADGDLWFLEQGVGKIAKITTEGVVTEFDEPLSLPFAIAAGPDGNIWFTERFSQRIGKVTPAGEFTFYLAPGHTLESITPGRGQTLLFTEFGDDKIAMITTDGFITESPEIPGSAPTGISLGPRGSIWFLGYGNNRVYRVTFP